MGREDYYFYLLLLERGGRIRKLRSMMMMTEPTVFVSLQTRDDIGK